MRDKNFKDFQERILKRIIKLRESVPSGNVQKIFYEEAVK